MTRSLCVLGVALLAFVALVKGHGMMLDPPGRSSMWRFGFDTPANYNDNELFCGGMSVQWNQHGGKCGECGDEYTPDRPRSNENGGTYGTGVIAKTYTSGETIISDVMVTTNHLGTFEFTVCKLNDPNELETEECFEEHVLQMADGSGTLYQLGTQKGHVNVSIVLPEITCDRCVLRWHYRTGNNWGEVKTVATLKAVDLKRLLRSCADIAITN